MDVGVTIGVLKQNERIPNVVRYYGSPIHTYSSSSASCEIVHLFYWPVQTTIQQKMMRPYCRGE